MKEANTTVEWKRRIELAQTYAVLNNLMNPQFISCYADLSHRRIMLIKCVQRFDNRVCHHLMPKRADVFITHRSASSPASSNTTVGWKCHIAYRPLLGTNRNTHR